MCPKEFDYQKWELIRKFQCWTKIAGKLEMIKIGQNGQKWPK